MKPVGILSALLLTASLTTVLSSYPNAVHSSNLNLPSLGDTTSAVISQQEEYELGRSWLKALRNQTPMVPDPQLKDYLENLIFRLAASSQLQDHRLVPLVIDSPVLNAFAAPGGIVGVNTGLFLNAETEAQFAAVLAHELAHLSQRHYARNVEEARNQSIPNAAAILGSILIMATAGGDAGAAALTSTVAGMQSARLRFSRQFEREADNIGITTLAKAGFDPQAMPEIFEQMNKASRYGSRPPEFLLTHPVTENRIADSRARADQMSAQKLTTGKGSLNYQFMRMRAAVLSSNNHHEMVRQLNKRLESGLTATSKTSHAPTRYGLVLASIETRDFTVAEHQMKRLLQQYPDNPHLIMTQSLLEAASGKASQGLTRIDKALSTNPESYPLLATRAEILLQQQDYVGARHELQKLSRLRPDDPDIWFELAEVQGLAEDIVGLHQSRAEYFFLNGNLDDAIKHLQYAVKMSGDNFSLKSKLQQKLTDMQNYRQKLRNS
ncbi:M48 family metalloprotease [Endozoicomonas sp. SCSIO W0465]|uniref:M48 family metalloprotease n=1 Tax=Endozoicomonas sp. SCSIO W0465 TaxID=2918516 RepID=UPI002074CD6D|nr:M48 family metalloprotease [Endozoicomonas sp. SCSIO W0465]USE38733.1 M48 family metalloprotease [Endozoicomonas sp. SCSIO W0465]